MDVPSDLFMYGSGIYQKTNLASSDHSGFHSVKMIGWGEERGTPYWVRLTFHKKITKKYTFFNF
jgi:hypothetical protein